MTDVEQDYEAESPAQEDGSLDSWMQARREAMQQEQSEKFPVPHYGDKLVVELRPLSYKRRKAIAEHHIKKTRDPAMKDLYVAADIIIQATVGFHVIVADTGDPEQDYRPLADHENSWMALARKANPMLGDAVTTRVALLSLIGDDTIEDFFIEWREWNKTRGEDHDSELMKDLSATR